MRGRSRRRGGRERAVLVLFCAVLFMAPGLGAWIPGAKAANRARIAHSAEGVALRAEPSYGAAVAGLLPDGAAVDLRLERFDTVYDPDGQTRWWPVESEIGTGWVAGFFLDIPDERQAATGESATGQARPAAEPAAADWGVGGQDNSLGWGFAQVSEPDGVNMRAEPGVGSDTLDTLRFGKVVELRIDVLDTIYADGTRWWPIGVDGIEGWVSGDYLAPADDTALDKAPPAEEAAEPVGEAPVVNVADIAAFIANAYVQVVTDDGAGLNIRADPAPDAERVGSIPESDVVQVMDGPDVDPIGNPWYLVTDGETTGWVFGPYLADADQPAAPDGVAAPAAPEVESEPLDVAGIATGLFKYPLQGFTFTQGFGCSPYWFEPWSGNAGCNFHNGVDLADPAYTPIEAADGGVADQVGWCDCGLGYYVRIDHGNGFRTLYGHMAEYPWASVGEKVAKGDVIGPVGSSGNSTGPHLHFIVNYDGVDQDPLAYLP